VKQETDSWVAEFQSNLAELEKGLKSSVESQKAGRIKVSVANATDFEAVSVLLNDNTVKELAGASEALIDSVPPRAYEVRAVGTKDNRSYNACKVVDVLPDRVAAVELVLPPVPREGVSAS